jgi:hypothetical protein
VAPPGNASISDVLLVVPTRDAYRYFAAGVDCEDAANEVGAATVETAVIAATMIVLRLTRAPFSKTTLHLL